MTELDGDFKQLLKRFEEKSTKKEKFNIYLWNFGDYEKVKKSVKKEKFNILEEPSLFAKHDERMTKVGKIDMSKIRLKSFKISSYGQKLDKLGLDPFTTSDETFSDTSQFGKAIMSRAHKVKYQGPRESDGSDILHDKYQFLNKKIYDRPSILPNDKENFEIYCKDDIHLNNLIQLLNKEIYENGEFINEKFDEDGRNLLNISLDSCIENKKNLKTVRYLLSKSPITVFKNVFNITVSGITSEKTLLHQLVIMGNSELVNSYFKRCAMDNKMGKINDKFVVYVAPGQREREMNAMHLAALFGHTEIAKILVNNGFNVDALNVKQDTPLLWAVRFNNIETVKYIISHDIIIDAANDKGSTALHWAVRYGYIDCVKLLISKGAKVNKKRKTGIASTLSMSASMNYPEILDVLLAAGGDVNTQIAGNLTPLHMASTYGNQECISILLKYKVDVNAIDARGNNALNLALENNELQCAILLLKNGININRVNKKGDSIWDTALHSNTLDILELLHKWWRYNIKIGEVNFSQISPLMLAAKYNYPEKAQYVLNWDIIEYVGKMDKFGNTWLHIATEKGYINFLEKFSIHIKNIKPNFERNTLLHVACEHGHSEIVKILIKNDNKNNKEQNVLFEMPMHVIARSKVDPLSKYTCMELVLNSIVKTDSWNTVHGVNGHGDTVLNVTIQEGAFNLLDLFTEIDYKIKNHKGNASIHLATLSDMATFQKYIDIFVVTKSDKINVNLTNSEGNSPLHLIVKYGFTEKLDYLYEKCSSLIDIGTTNKYGKNVFHILIDSYVKSKENEMTEYGNVEKIRLKYLIKNKTKNSETVNETSPDVYLVIFYKLIDYCIKWFRYYDSNPHIEELNLSIARNIFMYKTRNDGEIFKHERRQTISSKLWGFPKNTVDVVVRCEVVKFLFENIYEDNGYNVFQYAIYQGCLTIMEAIMGLDTIYCIKPTSKMQSSRIDENCDQFQVIYRSTYIKKTADILYNPKMFKAIQRARDKCIIYDISNMASSTATGNSVLFDHPNSCKTYLNMIVETKDIPLCYKMLHVAPLPIIIHSYWIRYKYAYFALMLIHIMYMLILSILGKSAYNTVRINKPIVKENYFSPLYLITLSIWPILLFCFQFYLDFIHNVNGKSVLYPKHKPIFQWKQSFYKIFTRYQLFVTLIFLVLYISWQVTIILKFYMSIYLLPLLLILGWLYTIFFTQGLEKVYALSLTLRNIFIHDILRFFVIYIIIICAFTFGIHSLFLSSRKYSDTYSDQLETTLLVFNMMIGMEYIFEDVSANQMYPNNGNLLIAMMNDSYSKVCKIENQSWYVDSSRMALSLSKNFRSRDLYSSISIISDKNPIKQNKINGRCYMVVEKEQIEQDAQNTQKMDEESILELQKNIININNNLQTFVRVHDINLELNKKIIK
ncbi:putative ankyrin repeat protein [Intoshia linei]|uniref:Putative ankyrin repeat protein n=1 Tax=Intoshia linei TaxID=1819745 RepID=A0A177B0V9_9BILA|nr:putative ankyrin repeat protein [Intoshia linei]